MNLNASHFKVLETLCNATKDFPLSAYSLGQLNYCMQVNTVHSRMFELKEITGLKIESCYFGDRNKYKVYWLEPKQKKYAKNILKMNSFK